MVSSQVKRNPSDRQLQEQRSTHQSPIAAHPSLVEPVSTGQVFVEQSIEEQPGAPLPKTHQHFHLVPADRCSVQLALPETPLFGTDGIRGQAGTLLTAPLATQVGFWAGQVLRAHGQTGPIILGQDSRNSSNMLSSGLSAGLTTAGLEVWDLGLCPTAAVAHSAIGNAGGIMISASHNPPADNGIKFFDSAGTKLSSTIQQQIESAIRGQSLSVASSTSQGAATDMQWGRAYQRPDLIDRYVDFLHQPFQPHPNLRGMRIVLDLAWGAATRVAKQVFESTGAEVVILHGLPDGDRINVDCGSTHLGSLKAAVAELEADIGFAFDGDADRVMAVDGQGRVIDGDYILYFWGQTLQQAGKLPNNTIISTVMANLGFERAWQKQGGTLVRTKVGDQHVHAEMISQGAMLGGEQSGHILCHHYSWTGDGILTALHLADLVRQADCSLPDLVAQSFNTYPQRLKNVRVDCSSTRRDWQSCDALQSAITRAETAMGDQGRVLVRASGTEPLIRVMVEAADAGTVDYWTDVLADKVSQHLT
ncbi:phosphoglucosamine mutase [Synechococcus sp. PCC 7335]|uniref:phosphoglucosamine mutase n=1 Tax=Synechococcus sp. (strain ATCC 29403 / PCC 7335) TaxID=91464 RepID=UPI00017EB87F|nr:phosphoglucosamine mutase [Synechococcus sp. PCC 7335]EDX84702.1 phosphoglucosamine mutase [Synechococcus sp. PCC 7335]